MKLRFSVPGDEPGLKDLWRAVFGDPDEIIDSFFREVYTPGMAYLAEEQGRIVAGAYGVPFGEFRYIFAVATLPEYRGQGLGRRVTLGCAAEERAYLSPAEPSLVKWYRSMGAEIVGHRPIYELCKPIREIPAQEYAERREALLAGKKHAVYSPGVLRFFSTYGKFYLTENGIAAMEGDTVHEALPCKVGSEPYLLGLNGAEPLYWGLTLA